MPELNLSEWIGSVGVGLLLLGFLLNLFGYLPYTARSYQGLNLVGASLACYAAWLIGFLPFVVLEGTWATVACFALLRGANRYTQETQ
ncbi:MAG: hypothetical protein NZ935_16330 [Planctomycetes bacterium]|nr:hypothetical protein [Planctomycetota bacterium]